MEIKVVDTSYQCNNMKKQTISHCQNCTVNVWQKNISLFKTI